MTTQTWTERRMPDSADRTADVAGANSGNRERAATDTNAPGGRLRAGRVRA
ncbi:hypothetical protein ITP53_55065 [Nonomuraea sp. K274]|uniref:Uncharacterized protein n=1 Tax=Nonomuraea cypriaca TaxID=1187855 RepID=A0A931F7X4_9ACTN|nr:hypothetical protein [Nonomuraea cypriaca]MBF8194631.1 hypothetical protein [Nonomuraea cypriaca]